MVSRRTKTMIRRKWMRCAEEEREDDEGYADEDWDGDEDEQELVGGGR